MTAHAVEVAARARRTRGALSGGREQRLSIVLAWIGQPEAAVLAELTTGLDSEPRRETWGLIKACATAG
jgi:ABC-2 type transport system ATP-binding protein